MPEQDPYKQICLYNIIQNVEYDKKAIKIKKNNKKENTKRKPNQKEIENSENENSENQYKSEQQ